MYLVFYDLWRVGQEPRRAITRHWKREDRLRLRPEDHESSVGRPFVNHYRVRMIDERSFHARQQILSERGRPPRAIRREHHAAFVRRPAGRRCRELTREHPAHDREGRARDLQLPHIEAGGHQQLLPSEDEVAGLDEVATAALRENAFDDSRVQ